MLLPGATLGVLGGGQLGRMFVAAARTMGYRSVVLDPDGDSPAGTVADHHLCADYADEPALACLAQTCDAITTEFENVPAAALERLHRDVPVRPVAAALAVAQDRIAEKSFLCSLDIATAPYAEVRTADDLEDALRRLAPPLILKRARSGYDGKGQHEVRDAHEARRAFADVGAACVAEQRLDLDAEISVILARTADGRCTFFPVAENLHRNGILHATSVPASVPRAVQTRRAPTPRAPPRRLAIAGVLAFEFLSRRR